MFCRLCALEKTHTIPIFSNFDISEKLDKLFSLSINSQDHFPKDVCVECFSKINSYHNFKESVRQAQSVLELIFGKPTPSKTEILTANLVNDEASPNYENEEYVEIDPNLKVITIEKTKSPEEDDIELEFEINSLSQDDYFEENEEDKENDVHEDQITIIESKNESDNDTDDDSEDKHFIYEESVDKSNEMEMEDANDNVKKTIDITTKDVENNKDEEDNMEEESKAGRVRRNEFRDMECYICCVKFLSRKILDAHIQKNHNDIIKYKCQYCSQLYEKYRSFTRHVLTHITQPQFKCIDCGQTFAQKTGLKNHQFKHKEEKLFECLECDKSFRQQSSLYNHKRIHTGVKNICEFCNEEFTSIHNLMQHKKSKHLNIKDRICKVCHKGYSSLSALHYHMLTHSKDRRHNCEVCDKTFKTLGILRKHMETHCTDRVSYVCSICQKDFVSKQSLATHVNTHINDDRKTRLEVE